MASKASPSSAIEGLLYQQALYIQLHYLSCKVALAGRASSTSFGDSTRAVPT
jgi:hypothetical protein